MLVVVMESPGNPIFTQKRVGRGGKLFTIYKIRTLYTHHFGLFPDKDYVDAHRITTVGRYLRRSKLDELPQLLNILLGDMSFIGPRPYTDLDFDTTVRIERMQMRPGLTGLAQISGNITLGKTNIAWMDTWYIENFSLPVDIRILIFTIPSIIKGEKKDVDPFKLHPQLPVKNYDV